MKETNEIIVYYEEEYKPSIWINSKCGYRRGEIPTIPYFNFSFSGLQRRLYWYMNIGTDG